MATTRVGGSKRPVHHDTAVTALLPVSFLLLSVVVMPGVLLLELLVLIVVGVLLLLVVVVLLLLLLLLLQSSVAANGHWAKFMTSTASYKRTLPSALPAANFKPQCRGANSQHVTARRASVKEAFKIQREEEELLLVLELEFGGGFRVLPVAVVVVVVVDCNSSHILAS